MNPPSDPKGRALSQAGRGSLEANRVSETDRCTKHPPLASKKHRRAKASRGPRRLPSALSPRPSLSLPPTGRSSHPAQPGPVLTWLPSGRATQPSPGHSCPQLPTPGHRTPRKAPPAPPSAGVEAPFVVQCLLATASSLQAGGGAWRTAAGKRRDEGRAANRRQVPASTSPPPLTVANPRAALRQPGGGGLWVRRRKQPTNQVAPTPYPNPHPPRIWFTAWSAGSSAAADWLSKAWSHPSDPKVLEGGGGGGPVQSASRKPPVGTPCC